MDATEHVSTDDFKTKGLNMTRNALLVPCTGEVLVSFMTNGVRTIAVSSPMPEDAKFVTAYYDQQRACFMLQFEHESFPKVAEGSRIPVLPSWKVVITEVSK